MYKPLESKQKWVAQVIMQIMCRQVSYLKGSSMDLINFVESKVQKHAIIACMDM